MSSQSIAEYVAGLSYGSLPSEVKERATFCTLDFLGVALAGWNAEWCKIVVRLIREIGGKAESTILKYGNKVPASNAALVNGLMGHSWDFDDTHPCQMHPGVVIVPTALAMAERQGATGRDLLTSIVLGYELIARIGLAVNSPPLRGHTLRGFHPTATCGTFSAAATAARLLNLNVEEHVNALGIAGSSAAGLMEFLKEGAMTKRLHPGKASHDGILSALLAKNGFTGPKSVFEGRDGFLRAYSNNPQVKELTRDLGKKYEILNVEFKPYSSCRSTHASIDALKSIIESHSLTPAEVVDITVEVSKLDSYIVGEPIELKRHPKTPLEAQMSMPYCLSLMLLEGKVVPSQFANRKIKDKRILSMAKKVTVKGEKKFDQAATKGACPAVVTVRTKGHRKLSAKIQYPRGSTKNPLTKRDLEGKFIEITSRIIPDSATVVKSVSKLESICKVEELLDLLVSNR